MSTRIRLDLRFVGSVPVLARALRKLGDVLDKPGMADAADGTIERALETVGNATGAIVEARVEQEEAAAVEPGVERESAPKRSGRCTRSVTYAAGRLERGIALWECGLALPCPDHDAAKEKADA